MTPDPHVEPHVPEASVSDTPSVTPERSSVGRMRGGLDPRALIARLSAQARRRKAQKRGRDGTGRVTPLSSTAEGGGGTPPNETGRGLPNLGPTSV
jgi:hypothetical protein